METLNQISQFIPPKYAAYASAIMIGSQIIGRVYHAIANGGGLKGILSAIWLGTNTPKSTEQPKQ